MAGGDELERCCKTKFAAEQTSAVRQRRLYSSAHLRKVMKVLHLMFVSTMSMLIPGISLAQQGGMMNGNGWGGGWMGGYGGMGDYGVVWMPILLVIVVVGLVVLIVKQKGK